MLEKYVEEGLERVVEDYFIVLPGVHGTSTSSDVRWWNFWFSAADYSPWMEF